MDTKGKGANLKDDQTIDVEGYKGDLSVNLSAEQINNISSGPVRLIDRHQLSPKQVYWLDNLTTSSFKNIVDCDQLSIEAIYFFVDLAVEVDRLLKIRGESLERVYARPVPDRCPQGDILYLLESFAESFVKKFYLGSQKSLNLSFSLKPLERYLGVNGAFEIEEWCLERTLKINSPNKQTIRELRLTESGLAPLWWDENGSLRQSQEIFQADIFLVNSLPNRKRNRFMDNDGFRRKTIFLYLKAIARIFSESFKQIATDDGRKYLEKLYLKFSQAKKYSPFVIERTEKDVRFLDAIFSLAYAYNLNVFKRKYSLTTRRQEDDSIKFLSNHLGDDGVQRILEIIDRDQRFLGSFSGGIWQRYFSNLTPRGLENKLTPAPVAEKIKNIINKPGKVFKKDHLKQAEIDKSDQKTKEMFAAIMDKNGDSDFFESAPDPTENNQTKGSLESFFADREDIQFMDISQKEREVIELFEGDFLKTASLQEFARSRATLPGSLIERINRTAVNNYDQTLIEAIEGGYKLLDLELAIKLKNGEKN